MAGFKKGHSGNPAGRPAGIPNPAARLRQAIANDLPEIIETLVANAKGGDTQAASLLLSRCLPPLRPESSAQAIAVTGQTLGERAESIVAATTSGELPASTAADMMNVIAVQARILETAELERRITALERQQNES